MAFTPLALNIETILNSDFIPDAFTKVNANFLELQGNFENLINDLQIDYTNAIIGVTTPIKSINTQSIILNAGTLTYLNSSSTQVASLTLDTNNLSVFTANTVNVGTQLTALNITSTGAAALASLSVSGAVNFSGAMTSASSTAETPQTVNVQLAYNTTTNYSKATLNLTNTASRNIFLNLVADAGTYTGSFNANIQGVQITVQLDATHPPADGASFTLVLVGFVSGSTNIMPTWATLNKTIALLPASNLAIQNNAPGTLAVPITFQNISLASNITFLKATFNSQATLLITSNTNMTGA